MPIYSKQIAAKNWMYGNICKTTRISLYNCVFYILTAAIVKTFFTKILNFQKQEREPPTHKDLDQTIQWDMLIIVNRNIFTENKFHKLIAKYPILKDNNAVYLQIAWNSLYSDYKNIDFIYLLLSTRLIEPSTRHKFYINKVQS